MCPAGDGKMTSWNQCLLAHIDPPSLFHVPSPALGVDHIGWQEVVGASRSGVTCVAQVLQYWGKGGSIVAHWDGMRCLGGTKDDPGGTLKVPVLHQSSGTLYILQP